MAVRKVHLRRAADIVLGSLINGAKTKIQKLALQTQLELTGGKANFNEILRNNSPSIYLVDPELIANAVLEEVFKNSENTILSIYTPNGIVTKENFEFVQALEDLNKQQSAIIASIQEHVLVELNKFSATTVSELQQVVAPIYNKMLTDIQNAYANKKTYRSYQYAAAKAGAELRRSLNKIKISRLLDSHSFINNVGNRVPFVTYTFTAGVSNINKSIQEGLEKAIKPYFQLTKEFKVGNLVHAGHVGLYTDNGLLGINMPAATIGGLITKKFDQIEQAVGNLPLHIENGLTINPSYSASAGMFLDLQFNFAVSMRGSLNSAVLGPQEVAAIKAIVDKVSTQAIEEAIREQISVESIRDLSTDVMASPTYKEFIAMAIVNAIAGKKTINVKHSATQKSSKDISVSTSKAISKAVIKKVSASSPKKINKPTIRIKNLEGKYFDITLLQQLLNSMLVQKVKENMGDGSRKDILNLRTGRFAESVNVERISVSREGMVTAFYSYMKYPYQTFEPGFRQGSPASRDPKLLISRSIREIAATKVANKLRAVRV